MQDEVRDAAAVSTTPSIFVRSFTCHRSESLTISILAFLRPCQQLMACRMWHVTAKTP